MKILSAIITLVLITQLGMAQNYIGLHKDRISERMSNEFPGFSFVKEITTETKRYLKFENSIDEETLLFILDGKGVCTSYSRMYNVWMFNQIKLDLDKSHKPTGNLMWIEQNEGLKYEIVLKRGEWFITITTRRLK